MKIKLLASILFLSTLATKAQSYFGYLSDNYAGVHSVINNPANIVDSRFNTDINLISASGLFSNNLYATKVDNLWKQGFNFERDGTKTFKDNNSILTNFDILGPSFMFNLNEKNALALFTRGRIIANMSGINGLAYERLDKNGSQDFNIANQNYSFSGNSWTELGLSYARIISDKGVHFYKAGLSAKYLYGFYNTFIKANNLSINYDYTGNPNTSVTTTSGSIETGNISSSSSFNDGNESRGNGFGADLGFTYEFRPNYEEFQYTNKEGGKSYHKDKNKYKFRLQFSITDLGFINYDNIIQRTFNANKVYTDAQFNANSNYESLYPKTAESKGVTFYLPAAIHLNADWLMTKRLYLNFNTDLSLRDRLAKNASIINNNVIVTPRYEVKWFSAYLPVGYQQVSGFQAGLGFRVGPIFFGSGTVISAFLSETRALDAYAGLKIPIYQGRIKDIDFDGLKDTEDNCPEVAGPIENKGCPWGDADKDGLTDNIDKCPKVAGPKENNGCPWEDKDKDGIFDKDDKCPTEAGPKENKGCPWGDTDKDGLLDNIDKCPTDFGPKDNQGCPYTDRDGDTVLDKDDACPDVPGTVANKGCAEIVAINTVALKKLNEYSKSVLFDTGKASIKADSFETLNAMSEIMKEYADTNFSIEGHTDNVGKPASNLKLSADRSFAIKTYLIEKGIAENRLKHEGFGSAKPIANNKTAKGKTANRRVEIKVVK